MALRVVAFDESTSTGSVQKELFRSYGSKGSTGTVACSKCSLPFAVFFPNIDGVDKGAYIKALESKISNDCAAGRHADEYAVVVTE